MDYETRLSQLGLTMPEPSVPPGAFSATMVHRDLITVSGQVPLVDGKVLAVGQLGAGVSIELGQECARHALLNCLSQIRAELGSLDPVIGFVRLAGYVAATPDFVAHGKVIDAASVLLGEVFGPLGRHARLAVGVASLPRGVPVEIELTAILRQGN